MTRDQRTDMKAIQRILDQSTFECEIEYSGQTYYSYIWKPESGNGGSTQMRVIIGAKGWWVAPVDWPLERCFV